MAPTSTIRTRSLSVLLPVVCALPWLAVLAFLLLRVRPPRQLPPGPPPRAPRVSVVVPARNEALNIGRCVASLTASGYSDFEVVVVDDRSDDGTGDLVRAMDRGNARALRVVDGADLPEGWLGKPWACAQGAAAAEGDFLLFTDADTLHGPDLLGRALAAAEEDGADLVTVAGRQLMESFWERLVQPQIFFVMIIRFFDVERTVRLGRWRDAIANGQFMLFPRGAYDALGGHRAVKDEVVEDLALAQMVVRTGRRLSVRMAEDALSTRMYRSLPELVAGWSKNLVTGGLATMPRWSRPLVAPVAVLTAALLWFVPPVALGLALALPGAGPSGVLLWSGLTVGTSVLLWALFTARMGAPAWYGLLYPVGALVGMAIFLRSWVRGTTVEWKGRRYVVKDVTAAP